MMEMLSGQKKRHIIRKVGLLFLYGKYPDGAVVKQSAVSEKMMQFKGVAKVFDSEETAMTAIMNTQINKGVVVVIRYEGPRGGPGMREMLSPTAALIGMGLGESVALITDGRFRGGLPGTLYRACIPRSNGWWPYRIGGGWRRDSYRHFQEKVRFKCCKRGACEA